MDDVLVDHAKTRYRLALAELAVNSAGVEHSLHDAVCQCFPARNRWMVYELVREHSPKDLVDLYGWFFPDHKGVERMVKDLTRLFKLRNDVIHGNPALFGQGGGKWLHKLESRRKKPIAV